MPANTGLQWDYQNRVRIGAEKELKMMILTVLGYLVLTEQWDIYLIWK